MVSSVSAKISSAMSLTIVVKKKKQHIYNLYPGSKMSTQIKKNFRRNIIKKENIQKEEKAEKKRYQRLHVH